MSALPGRVTQRYSVFGAISAGALFLNGCAGLGEFGRDFARGMVQGLPDSLRSSQPAYQPSYHSGQQLDEVTAATPASDGPAGCTNDFNCAYGSSCVKDQFKLRGFCARNVNAYGTPTFTPPNPSSVYPGGEGDCRWDTECAAGFRCIKGTGQISGHCLR